MSELTNLKPSSMVIQTYNYAASMRKEMEQLAKEIKTSKNRRLVFQTLPKHMRRRAMSHHPNRLPRNKRAAHIAQMSKTAPPVTTKRPSRLYRRRPRRLMADYARRMRTHTWLETHLWHARRFKMVERWGYKLAFSSTEKTYRASYRASKDYCLLQDVSYMCCLQLQGKLSKLLEGLSTMTSADCGPGVHSQTYLTGNRAGSLHMFRTGKYPFAAISCVEFMWRATADTDNNERTLWLWMHPSVFNIVLEEFVKVYELKNQKTTKVPLYAKSDSQEELMYKTVTKLSNLEETIYMNESKDVRLTSLKNKLNRFRLTGAKSFALLKNVFKADTVELSNEKAQQYWQDLCEDNTALQCLLPNTIIALKMKNAILPRAEEALGFTDNLNASNDIKSLLEQRKAAQEYLPMGSGLWISEVREEFTRSFIKGQSKKQPKSAIPGKQLNYLNKSLPSMPVMLVQHMGAQRAQYKFLNYGAGWDIILPNGTGMHMWLALIMRGARPGGLRETETINREMGIEEHLPDTMVGKRIAAENVLKEEQAYFKLPTNKRINYCAIGMRYAFRAAYDQLIKDWSNSNDFHVLRHRQHLVMLQDCLTNAIKSGSFLEIPLEISRSAIIQVQILCKRGMMSSNSLICLPLEKPNEKLLKLDKSKAERQRLRKAHKSLLKRLRARRVREKRKLQETSNKRVQISEAQTKELCLQHANKMRNLFLPATSFDESKPVMKLYKDTTVIGFVQTAQFSYTENMVAGVGYIALNGLEALIKQIIKSCGKEALVNVRDRRTAVDRAATIKINIDV